MASRYNSEHQRLSVRITLAEIEKVQIDRPYRDDKGVFYVEGVRNFVQLCDSSFKFAAILYSEKLLTVPLARKLVRQHRRAGTTMVRVSPEEFRQVSRTERASGVGAIVRQRWTRLQDASPDAGLCWIVLEEIRSPGNLGTLLRTSEAIGGAGLILLGKTIDPFSSLIVRPTMGALFHQQLIRTTILELQKWIGENQCHVVGASPDGIVDFHHVNFPSATLLFLGEERRGLLPHQRSLCDQLVRIPMVGHADSLNMGVAGGLLMYEVYRSRNNNPSDSVAQSYGLII